eukprot:GHVQ01028140.1.p1 GENE.GHVQ01028140.1~~GHVQ01028140.1.p1  ORF type:complete len:119 (-),score=10.94 GHVQ01028140.1:222-578(-)
MAKGLRCKTKRRYRSVKRQRVLETVVTDRINKSNDKLLKVQQGIDISEIKKPNAFLNPDDPEAVFPQHGVVRPMDFRAENLPLSGFVGSGSRRKFTEDEKVQIKEKYGHTPTGRITED